MILNRRVEILIAGLAALSLFLAAVYVQLKLKAGSSRAGIFIQKQALPCTLTSCSQCDINQDGRYNYQDTASLKLSLSDNQCPQVDEALSWCLSNCYTPTNQGGPQWSCQSQVFTDPSCRSMSWQFEFVSGTDKSQGCSLFNESDQTYVITTCQPGK